MASLETQVAEQRDVIKSLLDAFKLLTEENVKKDKRLEKIENDNHKLKELISLHVVDGLDVLKARVEKLDKVDFIDKEISALKAQIDDVRYLASSSRTGAPPPLPFIADSPSIGSKPPGSIGFEKIHSNLENILLGLEYISRQRTADVISINASLEKLDMRIKQVGSASVHESRAGLVDNTEIRHVRDELIPALEHEWSNKWGDLEGRIDHVTSEVRKTREEVASVQDKMVLRDSRIAQIATSSDNSRKILDKTEQLASQINNRLLKVESDTAQAFEEIHKVEESMGQLTVVESRIDLSKAECKANWERVIRTTKQDVDSLRIKLERISIVREEYDRLNAEMKALHDLVLSNNYHRSDVDVKIPPLLSRAAAVASPQLDVSSSSSMSVMDEGIAVAQNAMVVRLSAFPTITIPTGGAEMGALRVDNSSNRILWRIENMASMIREPTRYPKILVSPEFTATPFVNGKDGETLVGRMKLFPGGSDQSRVQGNCSFYLRCLPGVVVRYSVDIAGEVIDTFECSYEKQRDKGKHDFVKINEYLQPDGSVTIGIEIKAVLLMTA